MPPKLYVWTGVSLHLIVMKKEIATFYWAGFSMADALSVIPAAVLRNLSDKLYEKRKNAALEVCILHMHTHVLLCICCLNFSGAWIFVCGLDFFFFSIFVIIVKFFFSCGFLLDLGGRDSEAINVCWGAWKDHCSDQFVDKWVYVLAPGKSS